jgi:hypothetical protein
MMLAGAIARSIDDQGAPVFLTRGGVAMELRAGEKARGTRDVDFVLRGDPASLIAHLDAAEDAAQNIPPFITPTQDILTNDLYTSIHRRLRQPRRHG